ncbi:MAG: type II toxin-antitoxin system antitoxin SocA domain-containing protein [Pirellulales bacterium]
MILYICRCSEGDAKFGATKLNKLLFYSDFLAYRQLGHAITSQPYKRMRNGPVPRAIGSLLKQMRKGGEIAQSEHNYFGKRQIRTFALRDADLSLFSAPEVALVDSILRECWGTNATQISNLSHRFLGLQLADDGETIPYETALLALRPVTRDDLDQAAGIADELAALAKDCAGDAK